MHKANEAHINLLACSDLDLESLKLSINKAEEELQREKQALRKFQKNIIGVQKCLLNESDMEVALAEQLSLYIGLNSECNIVKSLQLFQNSIKDLSSLGSTKADTIKELFCSPIDELLKNDLKNIENLKREWSNSVIDYEQKQKRIKKGIDSKNDLESEKQILKRTATDYFIKRNQAEKARGSDLTQNISRFAYSQVEYYKKALDIAENLKKKLESHQTNNNATLKQQNDYRTRLLDLRASFVDNQHEISQHSYNIHQITGGEEHGNTIEGPIFIKRTGIMRSALKKKYGMINKDGFLYVYRNKTASELELKINILTSSVRQTEKKMFELTTTERNKPYILMAENVGLTTRWVSVIANARQSQLTKILYQVDRTDSQTALNDLTSSVISEIQKLPGNNFCADCRKEGPDWLSINMGILVCIECSGQHRMLGVNYSKIQSLTLDKMGTANLLIARKMGNELFNEAYEGIDTGTDKPSPDSPVEVKRNFITRKYVDKAYVQRTAYSKDLVKDLAAAISDSDMHSLIQSFAEGARPEAIIDSKTRKSCLHLAIEHPSLHVMEFLLQNALEESADKVNYPGPVDKELNTILHTALKQNLPTDYIRLITRKYPKSIHAVNLYGDIPINSKRNDTVMEVLNQAANGLLPKLLHVDFNWELNPTEKHETGSDDDIVADAFEMNKMRNDENKIPQNGIQRFEMANNDPKDQNSESSVDTKAPSLISTSNSPKYHKYPSNQQINKNMIAELKQFNSVSKLLRPSRHISTPSNTNYSPSIYTLPQSQVRENLNEKLDLIKLRGEKSYRPTRISSMQEKKEGYAIRDNLYRSISNGSSLSTERLAHINQVRETPKPLPRTIQSFPQNDKADHSGRAENDLEDFFRRGADSVSKKRNSTPIFDSMVTANTSNRISRSESISKHFNSIPSQSIENEYSTPIIRTNNDSMKQKSDVTHSRKSFNSDDSKYLPRRVEALFDCDGDEDDELTFVTGEIIQVTDREDEDWWIGNIESQPHRKGCFPAIFVKSVDHSRLKL